MSTGESWRVPVQGGACSLALSSNNEFVVLSDNGSVQRFDLTLPTICLGTLNVPSVCSVSYDRTGTMLVVAQTNGLVKIYDLEIRPTPALIAMFRVANRSIPLLGTRGDTVIGVDRGGRLFCLRNPEFQPQILWNGAEHVDFDCYSMAVHPFLNRVVVGGFGGYVRYYSAYNVPPVNLLTSFAYVRDLVFLFDVNQLAVVGDSGVEVWNLEATTLEFKWQTPAGGKVFVRSSDGKVSQGAVQLKTLLKPVSDSLALPLQCSPGSAALHPIASCASTKFRSCNSSTHWTQGRHYLGAPVLA